jgi:hypothetical protein
MAMTMAPTSMLPMPVSHVRPLHAHHDGHGRGEHGNRRPEQRRRKGRRDPQPHQVQRLVEHDPEHRQCHDARVIHPRQRPQPARAPEHHLEKERRPRHPGHRERQRLHALPALRDRPERELALHRRRGERGLDREERRVRGPRARCPGRC